jgi:predicted nuclease of predicted toxin-antitoxin system
MRVLLDENIDRRLRRVFSSQFEIVTVTQRGWSGKHNGELLALAEAEFDALVTMDKGIEYQQNVGQLRLRVIIVIARSNRLKDVEPLVPDIERELSLSLPGRVVRVSYSAQT